MMILVRFLVLPALLLLSACTGVDRLPDDAHRDLYSLSSQSMPKGYKYQDNTPISSPAPSSPWVKSAVIRDPDNLAANTAAWQGAVYELVEQIDPHLPKDGTPINLVKDGIIQNYSATDTYKLPLRSPGNGLDHYLRQILAQKGYNLTTTPDAGVKLAYQTHRTNTAHKFNLSATVLDAMGHPAFSTKIPAVIPFEQ